MAEQEIEPLGPPKFYYRREVPVEKSGGISTPMIAELAIIERLDYLCEVGFRCLLALSE